MRRIKKFWKEGWIENGGDSERCKWKVAERKRGEEKMG